jgi:hypothetical protein
MKAMMFLKIVVVTAAFFVLVLMGLNNSAPVDFNLPPLLKGVVQQPAALMYFGFFAIGLVTGAVLNLGGQKPPAKSPSSKPS